MTEKRLLAACAALCACASAFAEPISGAALWRGEKAMWNAPKTWPVESLSKPGVKAIAVEGEPFEGRPTRFFAYWSLPEGASPSNKVPGIVLVHGGAGTAFDGWVRTWNQRGYAAISMDNCGGVPPRVKELGGALRHAFSGPKGWGEYALADKPLKDQWPYHAISTIIRSHSFLRSLPEVDAKRIGVTGISWGGYLTACVAGIDDRFAFAAPVYGCAYLYDHSTWSAAMHKLGETGRRWDALWDAHVFLPNAKMPILWATGSNDHFFPLDSLQRGYDLPGAAPFLAIRVKMPHGHAPTGDPKEIAAFADHVAFGKPALPELKAAFKDGRINVSWKMPGRVPAKAQLIYTKSSSPDWEHRLYEKLEVPFEKSGLSAEVPPDAVLFWVNLVCDDGILASTRHFTR